MNTHMKMKTTLEDLSQVRKKLIIEIGPQEADRRIDAAYRDLGRTARIPGFRPGKAPRRILESRFGPQLLEDLTRDLVNETLPMAAEEAKLVPLAMPIVQSETLKAGQGFTYSAVIETRPEFQLKDYEGVEVEKERVSIGEEDVERQLTEIRKRHGAMRSSLEERGVKEGDFAIIDYQGYQGEEALEGVKAENIALEIKRGGSIHPELGMALVGLKKGETTHMALDFAEDHLHSKLAGQRVNFRVKILDIQELELPTLDDEFAKGLEAGIESLADLKEKIRAELIKREEKRVDAELKKRLLKKIADNVDFELPETLVQDELHYAVQSIKQNLIRSGSSLEKAGLDEEKLKQEIRPKSESRVKEMLILSEIARQQDLNISEREISDGFAGLAEGMGHDPVSIRKYYEANNLMGTFRQGLLEEKTLNYLVKCATVKEVAAIEPDSKDP
jgi:trigger factor